MRDKLTHSTRRFRTACGAIALIALMATGAGAISASAGTKAGANQLSGSWMVSVDRGPSLPALKSLQTYTHGGELIEISNAGATARSTAHGAWRRVAGRTYATTAIFFRYDPAGGAYLGTVKIRQRLELARDGQSFSAVAVAELRDPSGNLLPGSNIRRDAASGTRIDVEPIPEP